MANKVLASASFADNFLYVQLSSNPDGSLGHLYAIKTSKGPNIIYNQSMTPNLGEMFSSIAVSSVSMAVLPVTPSMGRNPTGQVFFAFNSLQGSQGQRNGAPFAAVRYSKNSPLDEYSGWNLDKIPLGAILPLPNSATKLWFAPGMAMPMNTGGSYVPAIYQLYLEPAGTVGLWIVQAPMGSSLPGTLLYRSSIALDGTMDPQIVSLPGDANYDAVIIGKCANANNTCLVFVRSQQTLLVTTTIPYDPTYCFAAANGSVIMASSTSAELNQIKYPSASTPQPPSDSIPTAWDRQLTVNSSAPGSILACAARGSTFYAVQRGDGTQPTIRTITLNPNKQPMSWQTMTLVPGITDNVDHNPPIFKSSGLSSAAIAGIIVAVIALLVAAGFFWRRSTKSKKRVLQGPGVIPPPLAPQPASTATYAAYNAPVNQPPAQPSVFIPLQPMHAPSPRPSARTNSWTQEPIPSQYAQGAPIGYVSGAPSLASMPPGSPAAAMANVIPTTLVGSAHISPSTSSYGVIPAASSTTPSPLLQPGDKHEVEPGASGDPSNLVTGAKQVVDRSNRTATGGVSSSSLLASPSSNPAATSSSSGTTPASGQSQGGDTTPPLPEILSPTLANAQLILQQSQQHAPPRALPVHHQPLVAVQYRPMPPHPQYQIQPQYQPQLQPPQPLQYPVTTQAPGVPVTYTQQYWDPNAQNRG